MLFAVILGALAVKEAFALDRNLERRSWVMDDEDEAELKELGVDTSGFKPRRRNRFVNAERADKSKNDAKPNQSGNTEMDLNQCSSHTTTTLLEDANARCPAYYTVWPGQYDTCNPVSNCCTGSNIFTQCGYRRAKCRTIVCDNRELNCMVDTSTTKEVVQGYVHVSLSDLETCGKGWFFHKTNFKDPFGREDGGRNAGKSVSDCYKARCFEKCPKGCFDRCEDEYTNAEDKYFCMKGCAQLRMFRTITSGRCSSHNLDEISSEQECLTAGKDLGLPSWVGSNGKDRYSKYRSNGARGCSTWGKYLHYSPGLNRNANGKARIVCRVKGNGIVDGPKYCGNGGKAKEFCQAECNKQQSPVRAACNKGCEYWSKTRKKYRFISSGYCSNHGMREITSESECLKAGEANGVVPWTRGFNRRRNNGARGCSCWGRRSDGRGTYLHFNPGLSRTASLKAQSICISD